MRRFFIEPEYISGSAAVLTGAEARHIATVLRLLPGTPITLFDGSGSYYEARITKVSPTRVAAEIMAITPYIAATEEKRPALHLAVGLLKGKKMDFVIQKSTELGVESLQPFRSQYCAVQDPAAARLDRWQKMAREACKQCNRPRPPDLYEVTDFSNLLSSSGNERHDLKLIFWEDEQLISLAEIFGSAGGLRSVQALVGPEGGFSPGEAEAALGAGFKPVTLGSRILRAETAALAVASILQHELGNLS